MSKPRVQVSKLRLAQIGDLRGFYDPTEDELSMLGGRATFANRDQLRVSLNSVMSIEPNDGGLTPEETKHIFGLLDEDWGLLDFVLVGLQHPLGNEKEISSFVTKIRAESPTDAVDEFTARQRTKEVNGSTPYRSVVDMVLPPSLDEVLWRAS